MHEDGLGLVVGGMADHDGPSARDSGQGVPAELPCPQLQAGAVGAGGRHDLQLDVETPGQPLCGVPEPA